MKRNRTKMATENDPSGIAMMTTTLSDDVAVYDEGGTFTKN